MKIEKGRAVALFVALGLKNADKWNDERISMKLSKVNEMVDEDVKLEEAEAATLAEVRVAIEAGEGFEVEAGEETAAEPAAKAAKEAKKGKTDEEKAAAKAAKEAEKAAAKEAKDAEKAAAKAAKEAEKEAAKAAKAALKGTGEDRVLPIKIKVAEKSGKYEIAGQVLAEFGMVGEITEQMCDRFIELFGIGNRSNAAFYLTGAWKAINSFTRTASAKSVE